MNFPTTGCVRRAASINLFLKRKANRRMAGFGGVRIELLTTQKAKPKLKVINLAGY